MDVITPSRAPAADAQREALIARHGQRAPDDELRDRLREACLRSTYAFGMTLFNFGDLHPVVHGQMSKWIERPTRRKLGLWPRDFYKTSVCTEADNLRRATGDPMLRILIVNEVIGNPSKWIGRMQSVVEGQYYGWLFPERVPDLSDRRVRWNQTQLELRRPYKLEQPTIEGIGVGGASTGNHYDIVHEDDLVGMEARESPTTMQKAIAQHIAAESLVISTNPQNVIRTVGTRWHVNDVVAWMLAHEPQLDYVRFAITRRDGAPLWPEVFPSERIEYLRTKEPPDWFALQRMNDALASGATEFDVAHVRRYRLVDVPRTDGQRGTERAIRLLRPVGEGGERTVPLAWCTVFQTIDAGLSPESTDARTANVVVAVTPPLVGPDGIEVEPFAVVVLEALPSKVDPDQCVRDAYAVYERWHPSVAGIEVVGGHLVFFHMLAGRYPRMRLVKLKTQTHKSKLTRIRESYPFFVQHRVYLPEQGAHEFEAEYQAFPTGRTLDLLDAFAYAPQIWWEPEARTADGAVGERAPAGMDADEWAATRAADDASDRTRDEYTGY